MCLGEVKPRVYALSSTDDGPTASPGPDASQQPTGRGNHNRVVWPCARAIAVSIHSATSASAVRHRNPGFVVLGAAYCTSRQTCVRTFPPRRRLTPIKLLRSFSLARSHQHKHDHHPRPRTTPTSRYCVPLLVRSQNSRLSHQHGSAQPISACFSSSPSPSSALLHRVC